MALILGGENNQAIGILSTITGGIKQRMEEYRGFATE